MMRLTSSSTLLSFTSRLKSVLSKRSLSTTVVENTDNTVNRSVGYWMLGMSASVAGMVAVGGITRLTKSGLSMTDWKLQGSLPPMNAEEWEQEFNRYKTFPEWQQRQSMTVEEFKYIYFWEWGHRMLGRSLGLLFIGPFAYFSMRGMIPRSLYPRMALLFSLGGTQGLIGWWMVKSGLNVDPSQKKEIRVSPYRLATHLGLAFTTYTACLWTGLDILNPRPYQMAVAKQLSQETLQAARTLRRMSLFSMPIVALTVISGAFVAGNDAGHAYNSFPMMGDEWIPSDVLSMTPLWRNFFENTATVQLDHRLLAYSSVASISSLYITAIRSSFFSSLPSPSRILLHGVAGMALTQLSLGVATLLLYVPISLAVTHQIGSLTLLTLVTCLTHSLGFSRFAVVTAPIIAKLSKAIK